MLWFNVAGMRRAEVLMQAVVTGSSTGYAGVNDTYPIFKFPCPGRLRTVELVVGNAITASLTNYFTLQLGYNDYVALTDDHAAWAALDSTEATGMKTGSVGWEASENLEFYDADDDPNVTTLGECAGRQFVADDILEIRRTTVGSGQVSPPILVIIDWDTASDVAGAAPSCDTG